MAILTNARRELFAQNLAKGMSADASHTAAGYKPSRQNAARMRAYDDIVARVAELQGRDAKQIMDVRDLARQHTLAAVETLVSVMEDLKAPHSARVAAANGILDRGYGKATQHIEAEVNVYDSLSYDDQKVLLAALEELGIGGDDDATRH